MKKQNIIKIKDIDVGITGIGDNDFISLTDIAKVANSLEPRYLIQNWLRRKDTIEYIGLWEMLNNVEFNRIEFDAIKNESGRNSFVLTPTMWIKKTNSKGFKSKPGKYGGGTFAHKDIALEFAGWISCEVKLYIIKEFQRLKSLEHDELEWKGNRLLSKINYLIHTDAIKEYLIPIELSKEQIKYIYASEADLLNVALFGLRAKEWKELNKDKVGNIRDYASTIELAILSNLEYENSKLIEEDKTQEERLIILNREANREKDIFNKNNVKKLKR